MKTIGSNIEATKDVRLIASGAISKGDKCVVNTDGTVSAISATGVSQVIGTPQQFSTNSIDKAVVIYSTIDNKIIVFYKDGSALKARVGIINATNHTISFPASEATLLSNAISEISACYDSGSNCGVVAFADGGASDYGKVIRVSIKSDNTLDVGSASTFHSGDTEEIAIAYIPNKMMSIVAFSDGADGDDGKAIAVRVQSNTNMVAVGSEIDFEANGAKEIAICEVIPSDYGKLFYPTVEDAIQGKLGGAYHTFMIAYRNSAASPYGIKGIQGYLSHLRGSDALTFPNTDVTIDNVNANQTAIAYDPINQMCLVVWIQATSGYLSFAYIEPKQNGGGDFTHDSNYRNYEVQADHGGSAYPQIAWDETATTTGESKFIVAYQNAANSNKGELRHITGTVSTGLENENGLVTIGSAIEFSGTDVTVITNRQNAICRDTSNDKFVIVYKDGTNGGGDAVVYQPAKSNLLTKHENVGANLLARGRLSSNFIGIATTQAADGDGVIIRTQGKVGNQSGLIEGRLYAMHLDGTLKEYIDTVGQQNAGLITHSGARLFDQNANVVAPEGVIVGKAISSTEILVGEK